MEAALLYLLFLLVAGVLAAVFVQRLRPLAAVIISILICVPSYFVWFALQYVGILPVDFLLQQSFGIDSLPSARWNTAWGIRLIWTTIGAVHRHAVLVLPGSETEGPA